MNRRQSILSVLFSLVTLPLTFVAGRKSAPLPAAEPIGLANPLWAITMPAGGLQESTEVYVVADHRTGLAIMDKAAATARAILFISPNDRTLYLEDLASVDPKFAKLVKIELWRLRSELVVTPAAVAARAVFNGQPMTLENFAIAEDQHYAELGNREGPRESVDFNYITAYSLHFNLPFTGPGSVTGDEDAESIS